MAKTKFIARVPVQVTRKRLEVGDVIEVEADEVANLVDTGSLEKYDAKKDKPQDDANKDGSDGK